MRFVLTSLLIVSIYSIFLSVVYAAPVNLKATWADQAVGAKATRLYVLTPTKGHGIKVCEVPLGTQSCLFSADLTTGNCFVAVVTDGAVEGEDSAVACVVQLTPPSGMVIVIQ